MICLCETTKIPLMQCAPYIRYYNWEDITQKKINLFVQQWPTL